MNRKRTTSFACLAMAIALGCTHSPSPRPSDPDPEQPPAGPGPASDPEHPSFKTDILPIFLTYCSGCHNQTTNNEGFIFVSYETITAKKFTPGDPGNTKLYEAITDDDEEDRMPRTPNPRLSAERITLIRNWIRNGAPNN
ncbi:c-type cytochrome domain-containing protein [Taibaiella helva]|uniref:c-type cytochrome domain-containing protein n=1 Tax=Taibaiella helva TaxID=2301235 RepID=UPI000E58F631|nr:c-type cytochrome domain-containing protein [Taibaiella helva]